MPEKKSRYTQAQKKAIEKYLAEKVETVRIHVPKGRKQVYKDAAAASGQSLNQFAIEAMDEKIERQEAAKEAEALSEFLTGFAKAVSEDPSVTSSD